jgi:hypothetical protein
VGAVRHEMAPGTLVGGRPHVLKAHQRVPELQRILQQEAVSPADQARGVGEASVRDLPGGGRAFQAEIPGRVPGSSAVYEKQVDVSGTTIQYTKTTYDPAGNIVHIKDKITGEVFLP